ncbi:MAG: acyl-ACP--UDP-N-acetylglucosamine O-acyltransferase [Aquabacterium sp.]
MGAIHPSAIVDPGAELHPSVQVGPYAVIGPHVRIGEGCSLAAHCVVDGHTTIGRDNRFFPFASIGQAPQDMKYAGEPTRLEIGDRNTIREYVTINTGTVQDAGVTRLGSDNWIMAYVHVAHDCQVGSHTILANAVQLAGHVHLGDWVFLGGLTGVHQFVRVGAHAMTAFQTRLAQDLPPFITGAGNPAQAQGINAEGLRRRGWTDERIAKVRQLHRTLYRKGLTLVQATSEIEAARDQALAASQVGAAEDAALLLGFLAGATRGILR